MLATSSFSSLWISCWENETIFGHLPVQISDRILCLFLVFQTLSPCTCAVFEACWHSLPWYSWHPTSITGHPTWKHLKGKSQGRQCGWLSSLLDIGWPSTASSQWSSFILYFFSENHGDFQISCVLIQFSSDYHNIDRAINKHHFLKCNLNFESSLFFCSSNLVQSTSNSQRPFYLPLQRCPE